MQKPYKLLAMFCLSLALLLGTAFSNGATIARALETDITDESYTDGILAGDESPSPDINDAIDSSDDNQNKEPAADPASDTDDALMHTQGSLENDPSEPAETMLVLAAPKTGDTLPIISVCMFGAGLVTLVVLLVFHLKKKNK